MLTARYELNYQMLAKIVQRIGRLVADPSPRSFWFYSMAVQVRIEVEKVTQGRVFLQVLCFSLATIIPPPFNTRLLLHFAVTKRTKGEAWKPSRNSALSDVGQQ